MGGWPTLSWVLVSLPKTESRVPRPFDSAQGRLLRFLQGREWYCRYNRSMSRLQRFYGAGHLHFITCSCYRRMPLLRSARKRDRFLAILEQVRKRYRFVVVGYVVMPEHIHLLLSEPEVGTPSTVMQVLKQRTARALLPKIKNRMRDKRESSRSFRRGSPSGRPGSTTSTSGRTRRKGRS